MSKKNNPPARSQSPMAEASPTPDVVIDAVGLTAHEAIALQLSPQGISEDQQNRIANITKASIVFAHAILDNTLRSADQTASLRKIREAKYTAVAGIATEEFL